MHGRGGCETPRVTYYPICSSGHLYQGRFKSFAVQSDEHFLIVARYIHTNPMRAKLVLRVEQWRWNDLSKAVKEAIGRWSGPGRASLANEELPRIDTRCVERSLKRGIPFGEGKWVEQTATRAGLSQTQTAWPPEKGDGTPLQTPTPTTDEDGKRSWNQRDPNVTHILSPFFRSSGSTGIH